MRTIDIKDWPREIERQIAALRPAIQAALEPIGAAIAAYAWGRIGAYQGEASGPGWHFPSWAPLAPRTVAEKERLGYAPPDNPLLRTGEMRATIRYEVGPLTVIVGSSDPVARWQELGTSRIPPRPFIGPALMAAEPVVRKELGAVLVRVLGGLARGATRGEANGVREAAE